MKHSRSVAVFLVLLAVGTQASNPLFDAFGIGKAVGDKLGGNVTHQANQALNQAVTGVVHKVNDTVAPIKAKVESVYKTVNDTLAPVQEHIEKNVLGPVRGVVKSVADGVQAKVDQATKLLPVGHVDTWKAAVVLAWLKESGLYDKLNASFPADGFKIPDIPAEIQKAQLQKLALLAQLNSTLSSAQQLKNELLLSLLKESKALDLLEKVQNKTGLPVLSLLPASGPGAGLPPLPSLPSIPTPKLPEVPSIADIKALLPNVSADDLFKALPFDKLSNLTGKATLGNDSLAALAKKLGFSGVSTPAGLADLKSCIALSLLKDLPHADIKFALLGNATKALQSAFDAAHAAVVQQVEAKLKQANDAFNGLLKHFSALKADPVKAVSSEIAQATKQAQDALDAKVKLASDALDAANKQAQQLASAKAAFIADPKAAVQGAVGNLTNQLESGVKAATDAINAAQKQAASVIDSKLAAIGLGGYATNASQLLESKLKQANDAVSNITAVAQDLKANPTKAVSDALARALMEAQSLLDSKVKQANDAISAANKTADALLGAKLAAANDVKAQAEGAIGNLTKQVEAKVKQANDAIFAAQKQAASVIDSKLAAIGLPGVAVNATQKLQAQVLAIGAAYQNLTKLASDIKADPHKAASQALAAASKQANDLLDAKVAALAEAYQAALKNAQAVVAFKLQIVGGAQTNAATLLASVTQQYEAKVKEAHAALAAARKQLNAILDAKLAHIGLGGLAANTSSLIDSKLKQATDALGALAQQAQAVKSNPVKAANDAIANATAKAQSILDLKIKQANDAIDQANKLVNQLLSAKAKAATDATSQAKSLLAPLSKQLDSKIKQANDAIASAHKTLSSLKASLLVAPSLPSFNHTLLRKP
ncbi:hypothetical protein MNEG_3503 [Monoraphidium neglectum]|uniref:Uncharacterized protein n=1 Tax=Monoraphidium neglectum TaxID=145388 RepID=A0A0D2NHH4_9CHLO|nr:hypothetical protein MNEG_3503 [Monoraphidium neglectum]KIZ04456.1 hypothetical protein MNEG_3503 [Monoraphidium neglectum]|eukprot:XP_013903475.1 hypothetical protein MNEG_3503 [Monoraphidium neglectum]